MEIVSETAHFLTLCEKAAVYTSPAGHTDSINKSSIVEVSLLSTTSTDEIITLNYLRY